MRVALFDLAGDMPGLDELAPRLRGAPASFGVNMSDKLRRGCPCTPCRAARGEGVS